MRTSKPRSRRSIYRIISTVRSRLMHRIKSGVATSRVSGHKAVGITWLPLLCSRAETSAGRSQHARMPIRSCKLGILPMSAFGHKGCYSARIRQVSMRVGNPVSACGAIGYSRAYAVAETVWTALRWRRCSTASRPGDRRQRVTCRRRKHTGISAAT